MNIIKLNDIFPKLEVISHQRIEKVDIYFISAPITPPENLISLREALEKGLATIREIEGAERVHELEIINNSDKYVIGVRGDIIRGGKQNRCLVITIIIPPKQVVSPKKLRQISETSHMSPIIARMRAPLFSCVEALRWHYAGGKAFRYAARLSLFSKASYLLLERRSPSRSTSLAFLPSLQHDTWEKINAILNAMGVKSKTKNFLDAVEAISKEKIEIPENAKGVIIFFNGRAYHGEFFNVKDTKKFIEDSIKAALLDYLLMTAGGTKIKTTYENIDSIINELLNCELIERDSLLAEKAFDINHEKIHGQLICFGNTPVYLEFTLPIESIEIRVNKF